MPRRLFPLCLTFLARTAIWTMVWTAIAFHAPPTLAQSAASGLVDTGAATFNGAQAVYRVRNLPLNAFPELPEPIATALAVRNCVIPQTYEAHRPENVIHGSFEGPGSADWAVLCSVQGKVSLLVFFAGVEPTQPEILATHALTDRLQPHDITGVLGFNWGIDTATPQQVHQAQAGMAKRPPLPPHDSVADSTLEQRTLYRFYRDGAWGTIQTE